MVTDSGMSLMVVLNEVEELGCSVTWLLEDGVLPVMGWWVLSILLIDDIDGITKVLCCCWRSRRSKSRISQANKVGD